MKRTFFGIFILLCLFMALPSVAQEAAGTMQTAEFASETLGEPIAYALYLPAGYEISEEDYPTLYLLHGRGDDMSAWRQIAETLDRLIADEQIPPVIAVMPDAPWSERASYYVDSLYTGTPHGMSVETAFIEELIPYIDATYRTIADRTTRIVSGYSMGGYGALRYVLAHPDVFSGAIVLSPAVYTPLPPVDSSTREFGAFGQGDQLFDEAIYTALNYPSLLETFDDAHLPISMFIAVGDDEWKNENPDDWLHDLDIEAHLVFNRVVRAQSITSEFRAYDGGHDWGVWQRGFIEGMLFLAPRLRAASE